CQPGDSVDTGNGVFYYSGARMTDHNSNQGGYGWLTAEETIWNSSNIGVAKLILKAYENNPSKFVDGLYRIGMNADLKLEIPGAGRSKIKHPKDTDTYWSKLSLPWISFGYETQVPPINTLTFFNAIANNGKMVRPIFTKEIQKNGKTVKSFSSEVIISSICSKRTLDIIQDMLSGVVQYGTGKAVKSDAINIAGKTGTAQIASGGVYRTSGHQVSFCGYFPAENPRYSCIVVIRRPNIGYPSGGTMSGGVVKSIAEKMYATQTVFEIQKMAVDSLSTPLPKVKGGDASALEYVLKKLDIKVKKDSVETPWILASTGQNQLSLQDIPLQENLVPRVTGMGARDAIYLMEKAGLKVSLSGAGQVVSQSIPAGQKVVKGQTVLLTLR
ncbi:PASTA domain-containing protein, partial [Parabacteroides sp. OttesenSCG-928-G07]|nr:PASTA domain-containing protein [Parabacteroides sp. OttesenSCG-928-G07]